MTFNEQIIVQTKKMAQLQSRKKGWDQVGSLDMIRLNGSDQRSCISNAPMRYGCVMT